MRSMIETGARALYEEGCRRAIAVGMMKADGTIAWADIAESSRRDYRQSARALISAIRRPTVEMLKAGCQVRRPGTADSDVNAIFALIEGKWEAMIDAILEESADA